MKRSTPIIPCHHGVDGDTCPACAQDERDALEAIRLSMQDPETHERWIADIDAWTASQDCLRAEFGDLVPAVSPEVM